MFIYNSIAVQATSNYQGIFLRGNGSTVASSSNTAEGKISSNYYNKR
jgi:hypothetical protein